LSNGSLRSGWPNCLVSTIRQIKDTLNQQPHPMYHSLPASQQHVLCQLLNAPAMSMDSSLVTILSWSSSVCLDCLRPCRLHCIRGSVNLPQMQWTSASFWHACVLDRCFVFLLHVHRGVADRCKVICLLYLCGCDVTSLMCRRLAVWASVAFVCPYARAAAYTLRHCVWANSNVAVSFLLDLTEHVIWQLSLLCSHAEKAVQVCMPMIH
jgi:hypothetical protein